MVPVAFLEKYGSRVFPTLRELSYSQHQYTPTSHPRYICCTRSPRACSCTYAPEHQLSGLVSLRSHRQDILKHEGELSRPLHQKLPDLEARSAALEGICSARVPRCQSEQELSVGRCSSHVMVSCYSGEADSSRSRRVFLDRGQFHSTRVSTVAVNT